VRQQRVPERYGPLFEVLVDHALVVRAFAETVDSLSSERLELLVQKPAGLAVELVVEVSQSEAGVPEASERA
jgi:hypothetical protein